MQATQTLPPGLAATELEFFYDKAHEALFALYEGVKYRYEEMPDAAQEQLHRELVADEEARRALAAQGLSPAEQLYQYAKCRFGGFSYAPDISEAGASSECWDCGCTPGQCPTQQLFRANHPVAHGHLTRREIEVIRALGSCQIGYVLAMQLDITEDTLNQHKARIFKKTGHESTSALLLWAQKQDLL